MNKVEFANPEVPLAISSNIHYCEKKTDFGTKKSTRCNQLCALTELFKRDVSPFVLYLQLVNLVSFSYDWEILARFLRTNRICSYWTVGESDTNMDRIRRPLSLSAECEQNLNSEEILKQNA